jgi:hypothetical protein
MPYVQRDGSNKVIGQFARPQPGVAEEWLDPGHADLQPTLDDNKATRCLMVDGKTRELLAQGYSYGGKQMSLSIYAQLKLDGVMTSIVRGNIVEPDDFPISSSALDETKYSITDVADAQAMWAEMVDRVKAIVPAGSDLKQQILDAEDQAALDAITDDRT